jgi:hypothetical protein
LTGFSQKTLLSNFSRWVVPHRSEVASEAAHEKTHKDTDNFLVTVGDVLTG